MRACSCPSCGANLNVDDANRDYAFCQYCGAKFMFDDFRSTQRIVDEAKIRQAETDRVVRLKELELEEKKHNQRSAIRRALTGIWVVVSVIILLFCMLIWVFRDPYEGFEMFFYLGGPIIGGGAYLIFKVLSDKEHAKKEKDVIQSGKIRFPKHLAPFEERNYAEVEATLRSIGFKNITCVNMHDLIFGLLQKPGKVASITVDGKEISSGGKAYYPYSAIVITYHGK